MEKMFFFDIDDTLYDLADPFRRTCEAFFKDGLVLPLDELFLAFRKHGEVSFTDVENGQMTMREMYCYRLQKAFGEFGIELDDEEALAFQMPDWFSEDVTEDRRYHNAAMALSPLPLC